MRLKLKMAIACAIAVFGLYHLGTIKKIMDSGPCLDFLYKEKVYEKAIGNYPHDDCNRRKLVNDFAYEVEISELLPRPDSFYFVESSGSSSIKPRISCAIESAALHHKESQVYVVLTSPLVDVKSVNHLTKSYKNIHFRYINVKAFLRGTLLQSLWTDSKIQSSQFVVSHLSDILRYALLWRFGGTYVDTDVIFIKPLPDPSSMPNLIGRENKDKPHLGNSSDHNLVLNKPFRFLKLPAS